MKVLFVTSRVPFPPTWGAAMRDYQLARHMAAHHDVTLLCYAEPGQAVAVQALRRELADVRVVPLPPQLTLRRRVRQLTAVASMASFTTREESSRAMQSELDRLLRTGGFDVVQVESVRMLGVRFPRGVPLVLDEHNIEYELRQRMFRSERSLLRRAFSGLEYLKLRRVERGWWASVDACMLTSDRERDMVRQSVPASLAVTVPNGVDTDHFAASSEPPRPDSLVFAGHLSYRPNWEAVHHLVEEVLPLVRRERPACTLRIVGRGEETLRHLARPGVEFTGLVSDVRPYLAEAAVVVVPVRMGGGTRLKVLEALSMGKAVVSTSLGAEGIAAHHQQQLLIGDDPVSFAAQVVRVLMDRELAARLGAAAAVLARDQYSWARAAATVLDVYEQVVARSAPRRSSPRLRAELPRPALPMSD